MVAQTLKVSKNLPWPNGERRQRYAVNDPDSDLSALNSISERPRFVTPSGFDAHYLIRIFSELLPPAAPSSFLPAPVLRPAPHPRQTLPLNTPPSPARRNPRISLSPLLGHSQSQRLRRSPSISEGEIPAPPDAGAISLSKHDEMTGAAIGEEGRESRLSQYALTEKSLGTFDRCESMLC